MWAAQGGCETRIILTELHLGENLVKHYIDSVSVGKPSDMSVCQV